MLLLLFGQREEDGDRTRTASGALLTADRVQLVSSRGV